MSGKRRLERSRFAESGASVAPDEIEDEDDDEYEDDWYFPSYAPPS
jgi:hypothetical protein